MNIYSDLPSETTALGLKNAIEILVQRLEGIAEAGRPTILANEGTSPDSSPLSPRPDKARPSLPDPRAVRRAIRHRQLRGRHFDPQLFADPAWDMLLDLTAARAEHSRVSVTSLCIASGVPPTTALRWIGQMVEQGLFVRMDDLADRRRAFIALSDLCADSMARYFAETSSDAFR